MWTKHIKQNAKQVFVNGANKLLGFQSCTNLFWQQFMNENV